MGFEDADEGEFCFLGVGIPKAAIEVLGQVLGCGFHVGGILPKFAQGRPTGGHVCELKLIEAIHGLDWTCELYCDCDRPLRGVEIPAQVACSGHYILGMATAKLPAVGLRSDPRLARCRR